MAVSTRPDYRLPPTKVGSSTTRSTKYAPTPGSLRFNVPLAQVGIPIPYLHGRRRISQPNIIWWGNPRGIYETTTETFTEKRTVKDTSLFPVETYTTIEETRTVTTSIPVGLLTDIMLGICLGPNVVLRGIFHEQDQIWSGNIGPARATFTLPRNDTAFSQCTVAFCGGAFDQGVDPWITQEDFPGHVGIAYIILRGMRADLNPGALSFEVERFSNPLGLTSARNRRNDDINPASAIHEIITSSWGGAGVDPGKVDNATLTAAAAIFDPENNYCSVLVDTETEAIAVLSTLQQQTYSLIYQNPSTGKIETKPIREQSINYANIPKFGQNNIIEFRAFDKNGWPSTYETFRGIYVERNDHYEPTPVMVRNDANVTNASRIKRSIELPYPYVTNANLCLDVSSRDLAINSVPTFSMAILVNRDGATLLPGQVILVDWPRLHLYSVPVVVMKVRKMAKEENSVLINAVQYVMPDRSPIYDAPGLPFDPGVDVGALSPTGASFLTAPYWIAERAGLIAAADTSAVVIPMVLPIIANDIQMAFNASLSNMPGVGQTQLLENGLYPAYGELNTAIDRYTGFTTGIIPSIVIDSVRNPSQFGAFDLAAQRQGQILVFINNEIFTFESSTNLGAGQWQLNNLRRALIDTVPANHAVGSRVFVTTTFRKIVVPTGFGHPIGFAPNWRLTSKTINENGAYEDALSINGWSPTNTRTVRSPRPHNARIEGVRSATRINLTPSQNITVQWNTRTRAIGTIRFQTDTADNAEPITNGEYQYHRVYLRDGANTLHQLGETAKDGNYNSLAVTVPDGAAAGNGSLFVRSVNQFGESVFDDELPIAIWRGSDLALRYALLT